MVCVFSCWQLPYLEEEIVRSFLNRTKDWTHNADLKPRMVYSDKKNRNKNAAGDDRAGRGKAEGRQMAGKRGETQKNR